MCITPTRCRNRPCKADLAHNSLKKEGILESLEIGPAPSEAEDIAQVGDPDYYEKGKSQCRRYMIGLTILFPPPTDAYFRIKGHPHDMGTYFEVEARFDNERDDHVAWMHKVERNLPPTWEEMDKRVLASKVSLVR